MITSTSRLDVFIYEYVYSDNHLSINFSIRNLDRTSIKHIRSIKITHIVRCVIYLILENILEWRDYIGARVL